MTHLKNILDNPKCPLKSLTLGIFEISLSSDPHRIFGSDYFNYTLEELNLSSSRNTLDVNLVEAFKRLPNLKKLDLSWCKVQSSNVWDAIFKAVLSSTSKLNELMVRNTYFLYGSGLDVLSQCISSSASLKKLDLSDNSSITANDWKLFIGQLSENNCLLECLTLAGNQKIEESLRKSSVPELIRLMKAVNSQMKRLVLDECFISSQGWNQLVEALPQSSIESLSGRGYSRVHSDTDPGGVLPRLMEYRNLKFLHLGFFSLEAAQFIFNQVESPQCRVESIGFMCQIEDVQQVQQARGWITSLSRNSTVKSLHLYDLQVERGLSFGPLWHDFAQLLGERDTIDEIQDSNHTLEYIGLSNVEFLDEDNEGDADDEDEYVLPVNVYSLLQINRGRYKIAVARRKVIRSHFNGEDATQKLLDMNIGLVKLPQLLHWIGKEDLDLSIMYGFLCSQPGLFDRDAIEAGAGGKRKRQDSRDKVVVD